MLRQLGEDMFDPLDAAPFPAMVEPPSAPPVLRERPSLAVDAKSYPMMRCPPSKAPPPWALAASGELCNASPRSPPVKKPPPHVRPTEPAVRCSESM